jgi:tetratricopeptide (TPR) repeat protein
MARVEKTVFISYRRTNAPWVLAISQYLTHSGYDVFVDYTGVASGDFETVIVENIRAHAHFVVVLTPSALERCGDPNDVFRREIEAALDSKRNIVPLMLEGFDFDTPSIAKQLTGKLALLRKYNAMTVSAEYFESTMEKLRKFLSVALETVVRPASAVAAQAADEAKEAVASAPRVAEDELTAQQWFERGRNAYFKGELEEAILNYDQAVRIKSDFAEAFNNRAVARHGRGDLEGALQDCDEAIRLKSDLDMAFYNRGRTRAAKSELEGALADYTEAIRLNPAYAEALSNRGMVRAAKGDLGGALSDFDQSVRLQPKDPINAFNRGKALHQLGDLDGALADYNEAIRLKPDYADAFCNRGIALQTIHDLEGAIRDHDEAIRLQPSNPTYFNNRAIARQAKGDLNGAIADYNEAVRLKPDFQRAINNRDDVLKAIADRSKS